MPRTLDFMAWRGRFGGPSRLAAALAVAGLASACTALPEWADPGAWFEEETPPPSQISSAQDLEEAQSGDFPNLASVPDKPRAASSAKQRAEIAAALSADRENAQYSGQRLVAGGETAAEAPSGEAPPAPVLAQDLGLPVRETQRITRAQEAPAADAAAAPATTAPLEAPRAETRLAQAAPAASTQVSVPPSRSELAAIIYFAHGSDALNADDRAVLRDVVALSRERGAGIRVIGHASARTRTVDPVQHRMANLEVSQRRADSVAAALVRLGAARDKVRVEARADTLPVYHEFMPTGEAGNRRAEIFLEY